MKKRQYGMVTRTFTPHDNIKRIPDAFRKKWIAALRESKQAKNTLATKRGTMCCLGVGCHIQGTSQSQMIDVSMPGALVKVPSVGKKKGLKWDMEKVQRTNAALDAEGKSYRFHVLNDKWLTHPQIADLLEGKSVTVRKRAYIDEH